MANRLTQPKADRSGESGVSLIETAVAFLVIAILLAFALPAVATSIRAYNVRSAANHIAERLTAVRALAMAKNRNVAFSFNSASKKYGVDFTTPQPDEIPDYPGGPDQTTPVPDGNPDTVDPSDLSASYYRESLPDGVTATFPNGANIMVTFNSRGELPIGSAEQTVVVQNSGRTVTVRINLRGRITVE